MKCHIPAANTPARIEIPKEQSIKIAANESKQHLKHGRPVGTKDKIPQKRKIQENQVAAPKEAIPMRQATKELIYSKFLNKNLMKMNILKRMLLKRSLPKDYPLKKIRYLKTKRS